MSKFAIGIIVILVSCFALGCGGKTSSESASNSDSKTNGSERPNRAQDSDASTWLNAIAPAPQNVKSIGMEFKPLSAGTFTMGSKPHHGVREVTLTKPFEMGVHEVTQEQYELVMGENPSFFKNKGPQNPVDTVTWDDAVEFCLKLSALPDEKAAGRVYRLPTSAEWEYACRAGTTTEFSFGDDESKLGDYSWYGKNAGQKSHPVGQKKPNQWGLYDMLGNVHEWCQDNYVLGPPDSSDATDPTGPTSGLKRVFRGGSWPQFSMGQSSYSGSSEPTTKYYSLGFRVVRGPVNKPSE